MSAKNKILKKASVSSKMIIMLMITMMIASFNPVAADGCDCPGEGGPCNSHPNAILWMSVIACEQVSDGWDYTVVLDGSDSHDPWFEHEPKQGITKFEWDFKYNDPEHDFGFYPDAETTDESFITHVYHITGHPIYPIMINAALRVTDNGKNNDGSGGGDSKTNIRGQWVELEQPEGGKKVIANPGGSSPMTMTKDDDDYFHMVLSEPPAVGETVAVTVTSEDNSYVEVVDVGLKVHCGVEWSGGNTAIFNRGDFAEERIVKLMAYEITDAVDINCVPDSSIGKEWESDTVTVRVLNSYNPPEDPEYPEDPDPNNAPPHAQFTWTLVSQSYETAADGKELAYLFNVKLDASGSYDPGSETEPDRGIAHYKWSYTGVNLPDGMSLPSSHTSTYPVVYLTYKIPYSPEMTEEYVFDNLWIKLTVYDKAYPAKNDACNDLLELVVSETIPVIDVDKKVRISETRPLIWQDEVEVDRVETVQFKIEATNTGLFQGNIGVGIIDELPDGLRDIRNIKITIDGVESDFPDGYSDVDYLFWISKTIGLSAGTVTQELIDAFDYWGVYLSSEAQVKPCGLAGYDWEILDEVETEQDGLMVPTFNCYLVKESGGIENYVYSCRIYRDSFGYGLIQGFYPGEKIIIKFDATAFFPYSFDPAINEATAEYIGGPIPEIPGHPGPRTSDSDTAIVRPRSDHVVEKTVYNDETQEWVRSINAEVGETVEFKLVVEPPTNYVFTQLTIVDNLPIGTMNHIKSTVIYDETEGSYTYNNLKWEFNGYYGKGITSVTIIIEFQICKIGTLRNDLGAKGYITTKGQGNMPPLEIGGSDFAIVYVEGGEINNPPVISNENPMDEQCEVSVCTESLSVRIDDSEGDPFDWTIETSPDIGSSSGSADSSGVKTCEIVGCLEFGTTYTWFVNATDAGSGITTRKVHTFTTESLKLEEYKITIQQPVEEKLYYNGQGLFKLGRRTIIIGAIDIKTSLVVQDPGTVTMVKIFIDDKEVKSIAFDPLIVDYEFKLEEKIFGFKTIKVALYSGNTELASKEMNAILIIF